MGHFIKNEPKAINHKLWSILICTTIPCSLSKICEQCVTECLPLLVLAGKWVVLTQVVWECQRPTSS